MSRGHVRSQSWVTVVVMLVKSATTLNRLVLLDRIGNHDHADFTTVA